MPDPKIYATTSRAVAQFVNKPLANNRLAGQRYVDRITRSPWWKQNCPGFWTPSEAAPERVWVWLERDADMGAMITHEETYVRDKKMPTMIVGTGVVNELPANQDRWVYLHELAHVMSWHAPGHHDKTFCSYYILLVDEWIGRPQAKALLHECIKDKIRVIPGLRQVIDCG